MAKTRDIRTRVAFEGETEYKKVVSDIAAEHKKLNNELKAAQAEFKATGNAEKMFEEKSKLLNKQIEAQNKAIKTAEDALKKLKDNGVEKNSAAWVHWEKELTSAKTAMFNATAELNKLNSEFGNVTNATERATQETADYSETLKSIDKGVKFGNILNGLKIVKDTVGGVISTALRMGKALVMSQISGGDWAREIMTEAAKAGVSVEEYQARMYAQAVSGIDTNAITEGVKKTTENLATTDAELLKLYNDLGISTRKANGEVRNATDTFWDVIDALKGIEDQTTRSIYAQKLLGDQYLELRGLVDLGSGGYEKLIEEGKQYAVVTEDSVSALADMDAAIETVSAQTSQIKHTIQSELAPGLTDVANAFSKVLTDFNDFLKTEEGQRVFDNWNDTLSGIANTIENTDFTAAFKTISDALDGIITAFEATFKAAMAVKEVIEWITTNDNIREFYGIKPKDNSANVPTITAEEAEKKAGEVFAATVGTQPATNNAAEYANLKKYAEELRAIRLKIRDHYLKNEYESIYNEVIGIFTNENFKPFLNNYQLRQDLQGFLDVYESGEAGTQGYKIYYAMEDLMAQIDAVMNSVQTTAEAGGGGAVNAFNAAIEKGTADTKDKLQTGVAEAFSGMDSIFTSMGTAHGSAYINALSAQMARINSMLSLSPSYAYGGTYYNPAQSAYASPTSTANVSLYVGREKFGQVATPIVDARMGADLMTMR